ncbi:H-NS family nucleoid-associated regulatory protein [Cupriavidus pauculus]
MVRHGITLEALQSAGCLIEQGPSCASGRQPATPRYRDAAGHTWNGRGELPEWLRRAINAGQSRDHFRAD